MKALVASEIFKLRSTRMVAGLLAAMIGLVVTAVFLHAYGLPAERLQSSSDQLSFLIGWGALLGALFASLAGAMTFTSEVRFGTIRPTLTVAPKRQRVLAAKGVASSAVGIAFGMVAATAAAAAGKVAMSARGLQETLDGGDYAQFILGGSFAAALWAVIGLGLGTAVRSQVPSVVALLAWVLFVEGILVDNAPSIGRLAPAALAQAVSGLRPDTLLAPGASAILLSVYAATAIALGASAIGRDIT